MKLNVGSRFETTYPFGISANTPGVTVAFRLEEARIRMAITAAIIRVSLLIVRRS